VWEGWGAFASGGGGKERGAEASGHEVEQCWLRRVEKVHHSHLGIGRLGGGVGGSDGRGGAF
jgi:hypothetical protein